MLWGSRQGSIHVFHVVDSFSCGHPTSRAPSPHLPLPLSARRMGVEARQLCTVQWRLLASMPTCSLESCGIVEGSGGLATQHAAPVASLQSRSGWWGRQANHIHCECAMLLRLKHHCRRFCSRCDSDKTPLLLVQRKHYCAAACPMHAASRGVKRDKYMILLGCESDMARVDVYSFVISSSLVRCCVAAPLLRCWHPARLPV